MKSQFHQNQKANPSSYGLVWLVILAAILGGRLVYVYLASPVHFPIHTIKIEAAYHHIQRDHLQQILSQYSDYSFITMPTWSLKKSLAAIDWTDSIQVKRIWPDTLKVTIQEKKPQLIWNDAYVSKQDEIFARNEVDFDQFNGPRLSGPNNQFSEVLQTYKKLSKLLGVYGLSAATLSLQDNQSWEMTLTNGVHLELGKKELYARLKRFCRAYPAVFGDKPELLSSVDLRYPHGMAAKWKQPANGAKK